MAAVGLVVNEEVRSKRKEKEVVQFFIDELIQPREERVLVAKLVFVLFNYFEGQQLRVVLVFNVCFSQLSLSTTERVNRRAMILFFDVLSFVRKKRHICNIRCDGIFIQFLLNP